MERANIKKRLLKKKRKKKRSCFLKPISPIRRQEATMGLVREVLVATMRIIEDEA